MGTKVMIEPGRLGRLGILSTAVAVVSITLANPAYSQSAPRLSEYFQAYPFDEIEGIKFLDHPQVEATVRRAINIVWLQEMILSGDATAGPIDGVNGFMLSWACEAHNCNRHNWTVVAPIGGSEGALCYYNADLSNGARWFVDGEMVYDMLMLDCQRTDIPRSVLRALERT